MARAKDLKVGSEYAVNVVNGSKAATAWDRSAGLMRRATVLEVGVARRIRDAFHAPRSAGDGVKVRWAEGGEEVVRSVQVGMGWAEFHADQQRHDRLEKEGEAFTEVQAARCGKLAEALRAKGVDVDHYEGDDEITVGGNAVLALMKMLGIPDVEGGEKFPNDPTDNDDDGWDNGDKRDDGDSPVEA